MASWYVMRLLVPRVDDVTGSANAQAWGASSLATDSTLGTDPPMDVLNTRSSVEVSCIKHC